MAGGGLPLFVGSGGKKKEGGSRVIDAVSSIADMYSTFASAAGVPVLASNEKQRKNRSTRRSAQLRGSFEHHRSTDNGGISRDDYDDDSDIDGRDLLPLIRGEKTAVRGALVLALNNTLLSNETEEVASAIVEGELKLILGTSLVSALCSLLLLERLKDRLTRYHFLLRTMLSRFLFVCYS